MEVDKKMGIDVYEQIPVMESEKFLLREIKDGDAEDLLRVYPTFNNGYSKVAKSGGWYYVLKDGDVSEYSDEDGGLAYEGDVYFDFDVENIFGDEDGNLYALGNGGPLV